MENSKISMNTIDETVKEMNSPENLNSISSIKDYDANDTQPSSFSIFLGKRRSGKSILAEYYLKELVKNKQIDIAYLLSETMAGFDSIDPKNKFKDIEKLKNLLENFRKMNQYNKVASKSNQIKLNVMVIIDDMAVKLKSKEFNLLEDIAVNGRHIAYKPLSLHFCVLSQSLTKIPRVVRLNCDQIFLNMIASSTEKDLVMGENFYLIANDLKSKRVGRKLYEDLVMEKDYQFIVIENYKQNIKTYSDYVKKYRAII